MASENSAWYGLNEFGLTGAAAVVERMIEELGGEPRVESVADRAARFKRAANFQQERIGFAGSFEGVAAADKAFSQLNADLQRYIKQLAASEFPLTIREVHGIILITGAGACMTVDWQRHFANTLDGSVLKVDVFDRVPRLPGLNVWEDPRRLKSREYNYELVFPDRHAFVNRPHSQRTTVSDDLAGELLKLYLDVAEKNRRR